MINQIRMGRIDNMTITFLDVAVLLLGVGMVVTVLRIRSRWNLRRPSWPMRALSVDQGSVPKETMDLPRGGILLVDR